jgi:hypothetical protein
LVYFNPSFTGQFDLKSGFLGMNEYIRKLAWPGSFYLNNYGLQLFTDGTSTFGNFNTYQNLTRMAIYGAGHMVSDTQGEATNFMVSRFLKNEKMCLFCREEPPCPNNCTIAGYCNKQTLQCTCDPGYSNDDCSAASYTPLKMDMEKGFEGLIVGRGFNTFLIDFPVFDANYININILLRKLTKEGGPYLFVEFYSTTPSIETIKSNILQKIQQNKFGTFTEFGVRFTNTSEEPRVRIQEEYVPIEKSSTLKMLILVYNTNDFILKFTLDVKSEPQYVKWDQVAIFVGFQLVVVLVILVELLIGFYVLRKKIPNPLKKNLKKQDYQMVSQLEEIPE